MQELLASYCLTEPSSGSDAASLQVFLLWREDSCILYQLEHHGQQSVCIMQEEIVVAQFN